jgi:hypothetical protein
LAYSKVVGLAPSVGFSNFRVEELNYLKNYLFLQKNIRSSLGVRPLGVNVGGESLPLRARIYVKNWP